MKVKIVMLKENCYSWGMAIGDIYDVVKFEDNGNNVRVNAPDCDDVILFKSEYVVIKE